MLCYRSLRFEVSTDEPSLEWLLKEFRLIVNRSIRIAFLLDIRSRTRLANVAYSMLSSEHEIFK